MKDYVVGFFKNAYEFINPEYARNRRMAKLRGLEESGKLESMCSSEILKIFGIRKESYEF